MKDFKIITEENKEIFEQKIREYIEQGYEVKSSNISITYEAMKMSNLMPKLIQYFYAYLEKEI